MIRIGVLGAAKIAPKAIIDPAAKRDDCAVTAVACRDGARGAEFAKAHDIPSVETDYEALVARDDVDLVYNALPPNRHADLTIAALKAGKAVLCEKPFAMNAEEANAMTAASRETGRPLVEAFHHRFHPAFRHALALVHEGAVGAVEQIDASFTVEIPYREGELRHTAALGGGSLMDLGCYPLHWARTIARSEPRIASASAETGVDPEVDLAIEADLLFADGVTARIRSSMQEGVERNAAFEARGDKGVIRMINPLHPSIGNAITLEADGKTSTETIPGGPTYEYQLDHMLAVMTKGAAPLTGGEDAVANMTAIDAIYEAAGLPPRGRSLTASSEG